MSIQAPLIPLTRSVTGPIDAGAWVHIDGAFGLWAGGTKRLKHLTHRHGESPLLVGGWS